MGTYYNLMKKQKWPTENYFSCWKGEGRDFFILMGGIYFKGTEVQLKQHLNVHLDCT